MMAGNASVWADRKKTLGKGHRREPENMKKRKGKENLCTTGKKNYEQYHFTGKEMTVCVTESIVLCLVVDYLFFQTPWALLFMTPVPILFIKQRRRQMIRRKKKELNYQFKDALASMSVAMQAGYSAENAISACVRDLERMYGKNCDILEEFRYIESQQRVSVPVEELFLDLGDRTRVEDIENFAAVFYTAKRTGGYMTRVIQKVARMLGDKIDVKKEIEATLAAKKSEQMIMSAMPMGIILYLKLTSPGFLSVMYGNPFGIFTMSLCLGVYAGAYWMGTRIVDIEV